MNTANVADISMFENLQAHANEAMGGKSMSQMTSFNAEFAGLSGLTPEQKNQADKYMRKVLEAEAVFRKADDTFLNKQRQEEQEVQAAQQALNAVRSKLNATIQDRTRAAKTFHMSHASLEAPLKPFGVTVIWDEPKVNWDSSLDAREGKSDV